MPSAPPIARPVVFPLHGIVDGKCACGLTDCPQLGKHPACLYKALEYGQPVPRPAPGAGAAFKTGAHPRGSDIFVVDLDGEDAARAFDEMGPCPETFTVQSPREGGGWHLYFNHPGFHVKTSAGKLAPNIDIRGDGGIVVAPGSPHKSGGVYTVCDDSPIADAPEWLLTWLQAQRMPTESQHYPGDVDGEERERRRGLYAEYLKKDAPARGPERRGQGDTILFEVVQRGAYDLALPVDDVLELVTEHYDPRCSPMWGDELEERVHHKARCAKEESTRPRAEPLPAELDFLVQKGGVSITNGQGTFLDAMKSTPPAAEPDELGERWGGWDQETPPVVYLLDGLIPENKVVTFFAEGGSVKSWAAFKLAICVATGEPWLGRRVEKGRALILDYEDAEHEFKRRFRILQQSASPADIPDLGYKYMAPQLNKPRLWQMLGSRDLRLLVIDTLGSGMPSDVDENTPAFADAVKNAGLFTEALRLDGRTPCTVVIVAHANKSGGLRGSSAIRDSSDVAFRFEPVSETDTIKRMRMICDKPGPQRKPAPVNLELSDMGLTTFVDESSDIARNDKTDKGLDAAILLTLANGPMAANEITRLLQRRKEDVSSSLAVLLERGEIFKVGYHGGFALDDDSKRVARVRQAALTSTSTAAGLAKEAGVPPGFVAELLEAKVILERSPGRPSCGYLDGPSPYLKVRGDGNRS